MTASIEQHSVDGNTDWRCRGWWEQHWFGRNLMDPLFLRFDGERISGHGSDRVGDFRLTGEFGSDGRMRIDKHYLAGHTVLYHGAWDGEGTMSGTWYLPGDFGRWLIALPSSRAVSRLPISELRPAPGRSDVGDQPAN